MNDLCLNSRTVFRMCLANSGMHNTPILSVVGGYCWNKKHKKSTKTLRRFIVYYLQIFIRVVDESYIYIYIYISRGSLNVWFQTPRRSENNLNAVRHSGDDGDGGRIRSLVVVRMNSIRLRVGSLADWLHGDRMSRRRLFLDVRLRVRCRIYIYSSILRTICTQRRTHSRKRYSRSALALTHIHSTLV